MSQETAPAASVPPPSNRPPALPPAAGRGYSIWSVIAAASAGTVIEWYDFFLFGALASVMAPLFFPAAGHGGALALVAYLSTFAVGFVARPFGAVIFGRIGDRVGRKHSLAVTMLIMGCSTAAIGLLPTYRSVGVLAPALLILIRVIQGLALGGEHGGAVVYAAEHAPDHRRGFYTSFIQSTATLGLLAALAVVLGVQGSMDQGALAAWGWRVPFLLSIVLVGVALYVRLRMEESPIFAAIKDEGRTSAAPVREALMTPGAGWRMALALFGATAGQGVLWYMGQFYALFYLKDMLRVEARTAYMIVGGAMLAGMPLFVAFGALSDRIGRKKVMLAGCFLAAVTYLPLYQATAHATGNDVVAVQAARNPATGEPGLTPMAKDAAGKLVPAPVAAHPRVWRLGIFVFVQVVWLAMVSGPIGAYLVEMFPARVRYTAVSLPYQLGSGVFGGLVPVIGIGLCAATGSVFIGVTYPIVISILTFAIGTTFMEETQQVRIWDEVGHHPKQA